MEHFKDGKTLNETKNTFYYAHATACAWCSNDGTICS